MVEPMLALRAMWAQRACGGLRPLGPVSAEDPKPLNPKTLRRGLELKLSRGGRGGL